jgi:hypothetical protein
MRVLVPRRVRAVLGGFLVLGSSGGVMLASPQVAGAAGSVTLYVDATHGTGTSGCTAPGVAACQTLLEGVAAAEALGNADSVTVTVAAATYTTHTISITASDLSALTVRGAGASTTKVTARSLGRVFVVTSGTVTIDGLAIDRGSAPTGGGVQNEAELDLTSDTLSDDTATTNGGGGGGGVYNGPDGTATLTDDTFSENQATGSGGGVSNAGTATITHDAFSADEAAHGGGVHNAGTITITDDTFAQDSATDGGGVGGHGTATITDDTFSDDSASRSGGGVRDDAGADDLTDDTFSQDTATSGGGMSNTGFATLDDDTFSQDTATTGGGVSNVGTVTVSASIFDESSCSNTGGAVAGSYDVWTTTTDCTSLLSGSRSSGADIGLTATLQVNTAPTAPETLALLPGSPAAEEVPIPDCTVRTDERGFPRPGIPGQRCDAGAYEDQATSATSACIPDTQACQTLTSGPGRTTTASSDDVTVGASGRGTILVGTYRRDPAGAPPSPNERFFGIALSTSDAVTSLVVTDCNLTGDTTLEWWTGHSWVPVVSGPPAALPHTTPTCVSVTIGRDSSPNLASIAKLSRLSRFRAVVFGAAGG